MNRLLTLLTLILITVSGQAQDFSNKGRDFWIAYPAHIDERQSVMGIYITSDVNATGTIAVGSSVVNFTVTANQITRKFLGSSATMDASSTPVYLDMQDGAKNGAGIHIVSDNPVVVYAHIIRSARSAATLVLPTPVLGIEYLAPSYQSAGTSGGTESPGIGEVAIVATQPNTVVEITPSVTGRSGRAAGVPFTITLANAGDCYQFQGEQNADISGTRIKSISSGTGCKPIAVFSATTWSAFECTGASGGDNLLQQLFPLRSWGKKFITAPFINRPSDIYRIYIDNPATVVNVTENGVTTTLPASSYNATKRCYELKKSNPLYIEANYPISVVQYITSQTCKTGCTVSPSNTACFADPEMVLLNPIEQTLSDITFFSAHQNYVPSGQTQVVSHYVNVIIDKSHKSTVRIDNAVPTGTFIDIPGTNYSYLQANLTSSSASNPVHRIFADTGFTAIVYGYGNVESYGYNGGTNIKDQYQYMSILNPGSIINFPATCKDETFRFRITLPYQPTKLTWMFNNNANLVPNADVINTNPVADSTYMQGDKQLYVYNLQGQYTAKQTGTYSIKIIAFNPTSDGCGGDQEIFYNVEVHEKPKADFSITNTGCISDPISFNDLTQGFTRTINKWNWSFGDGNTAAVKNTSNKYTTQGTYTVKLQSINDIGCVDDTTKSVTVYALANAKFSYPTPLCATKAITFTDQSTIPAGSDIKKWYWDYGDGNKDTFTTATNPNHTYATAGNYTVTLQVENNSACKSNIYSQTIDVGFLPNVNFGLPEVCLADASAQFSDSSSIADNSVLSYVWNFDDPNANVFNPNTSTLKNPAHKYTAVGVYNINLTVTSNKGCIVSLSKPFTVNGSIPVSSFAVTNTGNICSYDSVAIKNNSTVDFGALTKVEIIWDAVNQPGVIETDQTPVAGQTYKHLYPLFTSPQQKTYTIILRAYSGGICMNESAKTVTVYAKPNAVFGDMNGICLDAGTRTITTASEISGNSGAGLYYGNGLSTAGLFTTALAGAGNHTFTYIFTSNFGCKDTATNSITVWPSPKAAFGFSSITCEKNDISFSDSSVANFGNIKTWNWSFGDASTKNLTNANPFTKSYTTANNYTVSLQVITDSGCINSVTKTIKVNPLPKPGFNMPSVICLPDGGANFTNTTTISDGSQSVLQYYWTFGDANNPTPSTLKDPYHKYSSLGNKDVWLYVTSKDQCRDSLKQVLTGILPQPKAAFNTNQTDTCLGGTINFTDKSNGITSAVDKWYWNFGDGATGSANNPSYVYADPGTYKVKLYIKNVQGCVSDTAETDITINPYPKVDAGPKLFVLEEGQAQLKPTVDGLQPLRYLWTPDNFLSADTVLAPYILTPSSDVTYRLTVTAKGNCKTSDTVQMKVLFKPLIPTAFSPNGDGINDVWDIGFLKDYPSNRIEVFNRYGQLVFSSIGYNRPWDGKKDGKNLPVGTYYFIIEPKNGRPIITGNVTILR